MNPVGLPGLAALALGLLAFLLALLFARAGREPGTAEAGRRSRLSIAGIVIQGFGIALPGVGPFRVALDPLGAEALVEAAAVAILMAAVVALFVASTRAMGRNWSLVARTRDDHALVTSGPFAYVRHPIYVALFLLPIAMAIALGHEGKLWLALPLYALGTAMRVREEERLLHDAFGAVYEGYSQRVKRFVPGVF